MCDEVIIAIVFIIVVVITTVVMATHYLLFGFGPVGYVKLCWGAESPGYGVSRITPWGVEFGPRDGRARGRGGALITPAQ